MSMIRTTLAALSLPGLALAAGPGLAQSADPGQGGLPEIEAGTQGFDVRGGAPSGDAAPSRSGADGPSEVAPILEETRRDPETGLVAPETGLAKPVENWFGCKTGLQGEPCEEAGTLEARGAAEGEEGG